MSWFIFKCSLQNERNPCTRCHSSSMWFVPWLEPNGANQNVNIRFVPNLTYMVRTKFDILGSHHICKMWCEPFGTNLLCKMWCEPYMQNVVRTSTVRTKYAKCGANQICIYGSHQMVRTTFCKCGANLKCQIWFVNWFAPFGSSHGTNHNKPLCRLYMI